MRLLRLADLLFVRYKFALNADEAENLLRRKINTLWDIPNKNFNILKACAEAGASKPKNSKEQTAVEGFKFCQELLSMVDYLKSNILDISLGEMREVLLNIVNLINDNMRVGFSEKGRVSEKVPASDGQFPHVSELIFQLIPISTRNQVKLRNELYSKARTGLSRLLSLSNTMLDELKDLELMVPEKFTHKNITDIDINQENPSRFTPQRAPISSNDIVDFIRQYGDEYGLHDKDYWELAARDLQLKEKMTTVINALNRGHVPRDSKYVKDEINKIITEYKNRKVI